MITIRRIADRERAPRSGLVDLLVDVVHAGASIGFLLPFEPETAARYWDDVLATLHGERALWVAEDETLVVAGSVQLALCLKENGLHRAEVQKLLVARAFRGRGVASALMDALETWAAGAGRWLLILDTEVGSDAEGVYRHLRWNRYGEVPEYARRPDGALHPTVCYYKILER